MAGAFAGMIGGLGTAAACYFQLHQAVHHRFGAIERKIDILRGDSAVAAKRFSQMELETLEEYVKRTAARQWNEGLDEFYTRVLRMPDTAGMLYDDVQSKIKNSSDVDK